MLITSKEITVLTYEKQKVIILEIEILKVLK